MDLTGKVSWKTLAMLGLSGGLVPSTSAIIVLLGAIQLNRLAFGGLLILAFGIGMAIALVSVGLGMVALRDRAFGVMDGNSIVRTARIWVVPIAGGRRVADRRLPVDSRQPSRSTGSDLATRLRSLVPWPRADGKLRRC